MNKETNNLLISNELIVSVVMTAYNQESYIQQAIESVLMQKTTFQIELNISNNHSTDKTDFVIRDTLKKYKGNIIVNYQTHERNIGMMANFIWSLKNAHGKYIAICEGDDYWTDPFKLEKQVNFMKENKKVVFCFHNAMYKIEEDDKFIPYLDMKRFENFEIIPKKYLFKRLGGTYPTVSAFFRSNIIVDLPLYFYSFSVGDAALLLLAISKGEIGYINESMAVYRVHNANWSHNDSDFKNKIKNYYSILKSVNEFNENTNFKYHKLIKKSKSHLTYQIIYAFYKNENNIRKRISFTMKYINRLLYFDKFKVLFRLLNKNL